MKNHNFIFIATLGLLVFVGCKSAMVTLPEGGKTSIDDSTKVYWVHKDGNQTKLKVFQDFPKSEDSYPQFEVAGRIPKQSLEVKQDTNANQLFLQYGRFSKNLVGFTDESMGIWIVPQGNYFLILSALTFSCTTTRIEPSDGSWLINGHVEETALKIEAYQEYTPGEGYTVLRQVMHSQDDARYKGTIVVLTDNFRASPNRTGCTEETYLGCSTGNYGCMMGWNTQMASPFDLTVSQPAEANIFRKAFDVRGVNITLSCEYLNIACCSSGVTRRYNTLANDFNLWIGQGDTIGYIAHEDVPNAYTECGFGWSNN